MTRIFALTLSAATLVAASPALAAAPQIDAAGAQAFRALLEKTLDDYAEDNLGPEVLAALEREGELTVEVADGYYAATLPSLRIDTDLAPDLETDGVRAQANIGRIAINAVPGDAPGVYTMAIAFPSRMTATLALPGHFGGHALGLAFSVEEQRNYTVLWDSNLDAKMGVPFMGILASDMDWGGLTYSLTVGEEGPFDLTFDAAKGAYNYTLSEEGTFSGPYEAALLGGAFDLPEVDGQAIDLKVRLGALRLASSLEGLEVRPLVELYEAITGLNGSVDPETGEPSPEDAQALLDSLLDFAANGLPSEMSANWSLEALSVSFANPMTAEPMGLDLGAASVGVNLTELSSDAAHIGYALSFSELALTPEPAGVGPAIPTQGTLNLAFESIPLATLVSKLVDALSNVQDEAATEAAMVQLGAELSQILADAGTQLVITDTGLGNATYAISADGVAKIVTDGALPFTTEKTVRFEGLEALQDALKAQAEENPELGMQIMGPMMALAGVQVQGEKHGEEDVYVYELSVGLDGVPMLNGAPLGPPPM